MENEENPYFLSDVQIIILERIKKAITGLTVKEAKDILYAALSDIDRNTILHSPS